MIYLYYSFYDYQLWRIPLRKYVLPNDRMKILCLEDVLS